MFSFLRKKKISKAQELSVDYDLSWFDQYINQNEKLLHVNWSDVYSYVDQYHQGDDQEALWCSISRYWMSKLVEQLPGSYSSLESDNFLLISSGDERYNKNLSQFLERCLRRLLFVSKDVFSDEGFGKYVVIVFADVESYYDYVGCLYGDEGDFGLSSGMYINHGYGHFVFVQQDHFIVELIAAHEMTHALLNHLPIPLWLNEGMAVNMEAFICGSAPEGLTESIFQLHANFWKENEVQEFWEGSSFFRSDDGQKLSYQLAQLLVPQLSSDPEAFSQFINSANWQDAGEKAMQDVYGIGLGGLLAGFLGEGQWQPKPDSWPKKANT